MTGPAVATIIAGNYLPHARVLAESFHRFHPDIPLFVRRIDAPKSRIKQVATTAKPRVLQELLGEGFTSALFIDPDVLVLADLAPIFRALDEHAILLTPHLLAPPKSSDRVERELNITLSGIFNGGLLGVSQSDEALRFLAWWRDRVEHSCREDVAAGAYYDQRWLDLVPPFFRGVHVLRDRGCNVAHWNLPDREVRVDGDAITVDGHPCRLVHFSGFDPSRPDAVTRYSSRLKASDIGDARLLFDLYASKLREVGWRR
jgi:hypothetical protein